ncbi:MAG: hypothetical protein U0T83_10975 [Bacteriovoracaceae bacterium]
MFYQKKLLLILFLLLISTASYAVEVGGSFSYFRRIYGDNLESSYVSRTYSGSVGFYLFMGTGLEFNYSRSQDYITENQDVPVATNLTITSTQQRTITDIYGIGVKQALLPRGSFIMPVISLGYAKQFKRGEIDYTLDNNGTPVTLHYLTEHSRIDSMFASFRLQINLFKRLSINGSVDTVFKASEYKEAKNYLKYSAGFSVYF